MNRRSTTLQVPSRPLKYGLLLASFFLFSSPFDSLTLAKEAAKDTSSPEDHRKGEAEQDVAEMPVAGTALEALEKELTEISSLEEQLLLMVASTVSINVNVAEDPDGHWFFVKKEGLVDFNDPHGPLPSSGYEFGPFINAHATRLSKRGFDMQKLREGGMGLLAGAVGMIANPALSEIACDVMEDLKTDVEFMAKLEAYRKAMKRLHAGKKEAEEAKAVVQARKELRARGHYLLDVTMLKEPDFHEAVKESYEDVSGVYNELRYRGFFSVAMPEENAESGAESSPLVSVESTEEGEDEEEPASFMDDDLVRGVLDLLKDTPTTKNVLLRDRFDDLSSIESQLEFVEEWLPEAAAKWQKKKFLKENPNATQSNVLDFRDNVRDAAELIIRSIRENRLEKLMEYHPGQLRRVKVTLTNEQMKVMEPNELEDLMRKKGRFDPERISSVDLKKADDWHRQRLRAMVDEEDQIEFLKALNDAIDEAREAWEAKNESDSGVDYVQHQLGRLEEYRQEGRLSTKKYEEIRQAMEEHIVRLKSRRGLEASDKARKQVGEILSRYTGANPQDGSFDSFLASTEAIIGFSGTKDQVVRFFNESRSKFDDDYSAFLVEKSEEFGLLKPGVMRTTRLWLLKEQIEESLPRMDALIGAPVVPSIPDLRFDT